MPSLANRPNAALLVIDVQNDVVARAHERDQVVAKIAALVDNARAASVPIIWVQQTDAELREDTDAWRIVPELTPMADEPIVAKEYGDAFESTNLESALDQLGVGHLVVTGAQTDQCIRCTIHGAFTRGYDVTLVADAHTTEDTTAWGAPPPEQVIAHTNLYWNYQSAPGRIARTVCASELVW